MELYSGTDQGKYSSTIWIAVSGLFGDLVVTVSFLFVLGFGAFFCGVICFQAILI